MATLVLCRRCPLLFAWIALALSWPMPALSVEVSGRVLDPAGKPVAAMQVLIWSVVDRDEYETDAAYRKALASHRLDSPDSVMEFTTTNDKGEYRFTGLPAQHYLLDCNPYGDRFESGVVAQSDVPKQLPGAATSIDASADKSDAISRDIRLRQIRHLKIQLVDDQTASPVSFAHGFAVRCKPRREGEWGMRSVETRIDAHGVLELTLPADVIHVQVVGPAPAEAKRMWGGLAIGPLVAAPTDDAVVDIEKTIPSYEVQAWSYIVGGTP